jgi:hypothetical protein
MSAAAACCLDRCASTFVAPSNPLTPGPSPRRTGARGAKPARAGGFRIPHFAFRIPNSAFRIPNSALALIAFLFLFTSPALHAQTPQEITPESRVALDLGLEWLAANQGPEGNWGSNDLGLVSMGVLAFLSDGHMPGKGKYGPTVERALNFILRNAKPSGLLNIVDRKRDMYNHGLATFVLGQMHGMTGDQRIGQALDKALKLIADTQCGDGGWQYEAERRSVGHDLSLAVMQAKALRSAVDSGLDVSPDVISLAIRSVRQHYWVSNANVNKSDEDTQKRYPGQFTYTGGSGNATTAMAAAGVVCMQEFGQYDDWRIGKNMEVIKRAIAGTTPGPKNSGRMPFDPYTLYYVGQALYQVGGDDWQGFYPRLRDSLVATQIHQPGTSAKHGMWLDEARVRGSGAALYSVSVGCFILAIPNRYLPILQEGRIEGLKEKFGAGATP